MMKRYLQRRLGDVTDDAIRAPVTLTSHGQPKYVLVSKDHFDRLIKAGDPRRSYAVDDMPDEVRTELISALEESLVGEDGDD